MVETEGLGAQHESAAPPLWRAPKPAVGSKF
jgi:hypothetical protein